MSRTFDPGLLSSPNSPSLGRAKLLVMTGANANVCRERENDHCDPRNCVKKARQDETCNHQPAAHELASILCTPTPPKQTQKRCLLSLVMLAMLFTVGCSAKKETISIFISGDTSGWITPCGCTSNQSGGLSRRDTLITNAAAIGPVLVLDVGGAVAGHSAYDWEKLQAILRGQQAMNLDAFNLGGPECRFPADDLRNLQSQNQVPFISANVVDESGNLIAPPMKRLERGGQTIAVVGVVDPELVESPMTGKDPYQSIYELLPELNADRVIVLAYMDEPKLRELAKKIPDVDAVIGGPTGQVVPPARVGHVLVSSSTNKGKFILKLKSDSAKSLQAEVVEVVSELKMAERQQRNLKTFYSKLGERDFAPNETQFVSRRIISGGTDSISGNSACITCHQADDSVWHHSKHAHAWDSLKQTGAQVDPACQRCHTTGYGDQGGFRGLMESSDLVHVGCENCHGPSSAHAADPRKRTPFVATQQCIGCHDHENSPEFKYDAYWAKITHGKK